jgi:hypothetical protein
VGRRCESCADVRVAEEGFRTKVAMVVMLAL